MLCHHHSVIRIICEHCCIIYTQGSTIFIPTSGSVGPFTGGAYVSLVSFSSVQFIFTAPKNDQYELIIRYEVFFAFLHSFISLNEVF